MKLFSCPLHGDFSGSSRPPSVRGPASHPPQLFAGYIIANYSWLLTFAPPSEYVEFVVVLSG